MGAPEAFLFSIIFSGVGMAAMAYGKTTSQPKLMIIGAIMLGSRGSSMIRGSCSGSVSR